MRWPLKCGADQALEGHGEGIPGAKDKASRGHREVLSGRFTVRIKGGSGSLERGVCTLRLPTIK